MKIEISDKKYWIDLCDKALLNIKEERIKKQQYWDSQSWWYKFCKDKPIISDGYETITHHSWNTAGEWEIKDLKQKLELPNCGTIQINPYQYDLNYILNWSKK